MRIIEEGHIPTKEKEFHCQYCGCVFVAAENEYNVAGQLAYMHDGITAYCTCPTCKKTAYTSK